MVAPRSGPRALGVEVHPNDATIMLNPPENPDFPRSRCGREAPRLGHVALRSDLRECAHARRQPTRAGPQIDALLAEKLTPAQLEFPALTDT
jgi:hypothetical protein